jgi:hypothetical protein
VRPFSVHSTNAQWKSPATRPAPSSTGERHVTGGRRALRGREFGPHLRRVSSGGRLSGQAGRQRLEEQLPALAELGSLVMRTRWIV